MKIVKIRNEKMFNCSNPTGIHYYGMYWNRSSRKYNAVQLTHIARKDPLRYSQADDGTIKTIRIQELDKYADSGITKKNYIADINGNNLHPSMGIVIKDNVPTYMSERIKSNIEFNCSRGLKRRISRR